MKENTSLTEHNEELVRKLKDCGSGKCDLCDHYPKEGCMYALMEEAADAIEELLAERDGKNINEQICKLANIDDIGDLSDGYHTFNGLYEQRMILFAALVKAYRNCAWKSHRHEDGDLCFGGGWFIVGIDTPKGSYTYHYEDKDWDMFDCAELLTGKHWDGHTEEDARERLLSLPTPPKEEEE